MRRWFLCLIGCHVWVKYDYGVFCCECDRPAPANGGEDE